MGSVVLEQSVCYTTLIHIGLFHIVIGSRRRLFTLYGFSVVPGAIREQRSWGAESVENLFVFLPEVLVEQPVDDSIQTAVEIRHEVAGNKQPLRDIRRHSSGIYRHGESDEVQRCPAHGKQHKHHKHRQEIPQVGRSDLRIGPHTTFDPNHQRPYAQVAERDHAQRNEKVDQNNADGIRRACRLGERAGEDAWVIF